MKDIEQSPLVAICCLVYNHACYLRDCFEGFVMQQTNFSFIVIVHDDASTDASVTIIREYEKKYPHIFKPMYEELNIYSQGGFEAVNQVMNKAINMTGAKYMALCEGDDCWIDPFKLQKQVDVLESSPYYTMCYTNYANIDHYSNPIFWKNKEINISRSKTGEIFSELLKGNFVQTCTMLFRTEICMDTEFLARLDYEYALQNAISGECIFLDDVTANYRLQPNSAIHTMNEQLKRITIEIWSRYVDRYLNKKRYKRTLFKHIRIMSTISARMISMVRSDDSNEIVVVNKILKANPILYIYLPFGLIIRALHVARKMFIKK